MASVNQVFILGYLGNKPEMKYLPSGKGVCTFSVATNSNWTDDDGKKQESVEWHRIVAWEALGERCAQYLDKGRPVHLQGRLQTRTWEDDDGKKHYMTEIVAYSVQFLGSPDKDESSEEERSPRKGIGKPQHKDGLKGKGGRGKPSDSDFPGR